MAKKIIWSKRARKERAGILQYWADRNKSKNYSDKLNNLFNEAIHLLSEHPQIGKVTSRNEIRCEVVKDYLLLYREDAKAVYILSIWDSRQDPNRMKLE